jgi:SAM-dependent methyltransferase
MTTLSPLAYLLGLEGAALMRAFAGDYPEAAFVEARIAEIRRLLDEPGLQGAVEMGGVDAPAGYAVWSRTYDLPGNGAFPLEEPFVLRILDGLPAGRALDAACGTGRYAKLLLERGHRVVGVDSSPDMLAVARGQTADVEFRLGDLAALPVEDGGFDIVVCGLALTHVEDLAPVMGEFARVLAPGGRLVVSNMHAESILFGSIPRVLTDQGQNARIATFRHTTGDYFRAARAAGLTAVSCEEPRLRLGDGSPAQAFADGPLQAGDWRDWPWNLNDLVPQAAWAAHAGRPGTVIWHFQLPAD